MNHEKEGGGCWTGAGGWPVPESGVPPGVFGRWRVVALLPDPDTPDVRDEERAGVASLSEDDWAPAGRSPPKLSNLHSTGSVLLGCVKDGKIECSIGSPRSREALTMLAAHVILHEHFVRVHKNSIVAAEVGEIRTVHRQAV